MNKLFLIFVCSYCFLSPAFANDEQGTRYKTVYEIDQLDQSKANRFLEPLVQTNEIEQAAEEQIQMIRPKDRGKINVRDVRQIFPNITVPFTTDVIQTFQQGKRPVKGRRPVLMWHITSPDQIRQINRLHSNKQLIGGAFIYESSARSSL